MHSRKVEPARRHLRAAEDLLLEMEHEAGCPCCRRRRTAEDDFALRMDTQRGYVHLWFLLALCGWGVFAVYFAVQVWR